MPLKRKQNDNPVAPVRQQYSYILLIYSTIYACAFTHGVKADFTIR